MNWLCKIDSRQKWVTKSMLGSAVTRINFEWIDYVKLILGKSGLNVKWFMFGYIRSCKSELKNKFKAKNQSLKPKATNSNYKLKSTLEAE